VNRRVDQRNGSSNSLFPFLKSGKIGAEAKIAEDAMAKVLQQDKVLFSAESGKNDLTDLQYLSFNDGRVGRLASSF